MTRYYYMPGCMNDGTVTHVIAATRVGIRTHTSGTYADMRHEVVWYGPANARRYAVRAWVVGSVAYDERRCDSREAADTEFARLVSLMTPQRAERLR